MTATTRALVKSALLVWARESAGLSAEAAAQRAAISLERLNDWEAGGGLPSLPQLRKLAEVYKRPIAVFYLAEPPKTFDVLRDFRRLPEGIEATLSSAVLLEARRARYRRQVALELAGELGETLRPFPVTATMENNVEQLAASIRDVLDVPLELQFQWREKYEALKNWKQAIEALGVLVFQSTGVPVSEMRGFSQSEQYLPIIVINSKDSPRGRIFTLLHELVHLSLRTSGVCDMHESTGRDPSSDRIEVFCNRVAGAVLVPQHALLQQLEALTGSRRAAPADQHISRLAERFSVSQEALLRSLVFAGVVTEEFYAAKRREYLEAYARKEAKRKPAPVPVYRRAIGWNGYRYSRLVLEAYDEERISGSDLSDYLGVKLRHIDDIRHALARREAAE